MKHVLVRGLFSIALAFGPAVRVADGQGVANPHGSGVPDCASCHRSDAWRPVQISRAFRHAPDRFPLTGAHATVSCISCHRKLDFSGTTAACASCHRDPHLARLGNDCARCHTTRSFVDRAVMLRAHQLTRFPLIGAHRGAACESCHMPASQGQPQYAGRPTACTACHQRQLLAARNPDHVAAGFSTQCGSCHLPTYWNRAVFDHSGTAFPLTGAHRAQPCVSCHADAVYRGKPSSCVSCHLDDYQRASDPNHLAAQFPSTCASCHVTTRWEGATFDHDGRYFPIYSGRHRGTWASCATCHTNASNYQVFSCLSCHRSAETNEHHKEVTGYRYDSPSCHSCHRDGRAP